MHAMPGMSGMSAMVNAGAAFSPADISGLAIWAEADMTGGDLVLVSGKASSWGDTDLDPLVQGTAAKRPTFVADRGDGLSELTLDGTDDRMEVASIALSSSFTAFWVVKNSLGNAFLCEQSADASSNDGVRLDVRSATDIRLHVRRASTNATRKVTDLDLVDGAYHLVTFEHDGTFAGMRLYRDQVEGSYATITSNDLGVSDVTAAFYAFDSFYSVKGVTGATAAFLWYNGILSSDNRALVESYLNNEWSIF